MKDFDSWTSIDDIEFYKVVDKSVIEYLESGIPQEARYLFDLEEIGKSVTLIFDFKSYKTKLEVTHHGSSRGKILFRDVIKDMKPLIEIGDFLYFKKIEKDVFTIELIKCEKDLSNEVDSMNIEVSTEGRKIAYYTTRYERIAKNREKAIKTQGTRCMICNFAFSDKYGELGDNYIEVHHINPLYTLTEEVKIDPTKDLICLCANCHRMLHRFRTQIILPEKLKEIIEEHEVKA